MPGNLSLIANTFSSTNTNGNINIAPNGTGQVLIGTNLAAINNPNIFQIAKNGAQGTLVIGTYINSSAPPTIQTVKSRSTTIGSNSGVMNGDSLFLLSAFADDGADVLSSASIGVNVTGSVSTGIVPTNMFFRTKTLGGTLTTALTLNNDQSATFASTISGLGIISGTSSGASNNYFQSFSQTTNLGSMQISSNNNSGNYANALTNIATTAARTWSLPDASGTIALTSGASGIVSAGLINELAWYAASGSTLSGLATANNGTLVTSNTGVPSISSTLPAAVQGNITALGNIGQTLNISGGNQFNALNLIGTTGYVYQQFTNNVGNQLAIIAGTNQNASGSGTYATFYNYQGSNFSFYSAMDSLSPLLLSLASASFTGQLIAPSIAFSSTSGIIGTTTNDNANAGSVGEVMTQTAGPATLTSTTPLTIASRVLTAGDWDVWGSVDFIAGAATNVLYLSGGISTTTNTLPASPLYSAVSYGSLGLVIYGGIGADVAFPVPSYRVTVANATTVTIYLVVFGYFSAGALTAAGTIYARRRR